MDAPSASVRNTGRRVLRACAVVSALLPACAASAATHRYTAANWNGSEQRTVVKAGLMSEAAGGFAGATALTPQATSQALSAYAAHQASAAPGAVPASPPSPPPAAQAGATVSLVRFDALAVGQLGLGDISAHVQQTAVAAGLRPPSYFGSEVVARYLGLRYDHPAGEDSLELYPWSAITRAEAAHSLAVMLQAGNRAIEEARQTLGAFSLPHFDADQLTVLRLAVSKIGMPYVWGGTTDDTSDGLEHGGYDCSGFAWRVYKVSGLAWGAQILGRTAAEQAGEIPRAARVRLAAVQPADLLFFGSAHFGSKATEANVDHEGLALSSEWAIHSSGQGAYVLPLSSGWLASQFTWARRLL